MGMYSGHMATKDGEVAEGIRAAISRRGTSIAWLSRQTGITRSVLRYQLDVKPSKLTVGNFLLIADALETPPWELVA